MNSAVTVTLPRGHWLNGTCYREAELRPLTGLDEAFLLDIGETMFPAQLTTWILARCTLSVGPLTPVAPDTIRNFSVGDREALLLHLRRITLGDRIECVSACPKPACSSKMDLELSVSDLLVPQYGNAKASYETCITDSNDGTGYHVSFRLPTGADQEATANLARTNPIEAVDQVLHRCIQRVVANGKEIKDLPAVVAEQLPGAMAESDPQAELVLNMTCPNCGLAFSRIFDTATFFFQEIKNRTEQFFREVHLMAFHYHWSEAEILDMPSKRRQRYLERLVEKPKEK